MLSLYKYKLKMNAGQGFVVRDFTADLLGLGVDFGTFAIYRENMLKKFGKMSF